MKNLHRLPHRFIWRFSASLLLLLAVGLPAHAQDPPAPPTLDVDTLRTPDLRPEEAEALLAFWNDSATIHFSGRTRIPAGRTVSGDVAVLEGPLVVAGRIEGRAVVINGDAELLPGATITGELAVVGGSVAMDEGASVGGGILVYEEALRFRREGERLVYAGPRFVFGEPEARAPSGQADFLVTTGASYNRVEGLPILFGPIVTTGGSNPLRVRALGVYRTESGVSLDPERMGYIASAEQFIGGRRMFRFGVGFHSLIEPVEDWHLSKLENGLSTFLLRRDYRDHYEREGWSVFAGWASEDLPLALRLELRSERHRTAAVGSPWTLFRTGSGWRPQPLVAEGRLRSVLVDASYDTRSRPDDPATGWYVHGEVERTFNTRLSTPAAVRPTEPIGFPPSFTIFPTETFDGFTAGFLDVRRYNRIGPESRLNFRLLTGGTLDGSPLPPQRQHALGGEGSLPGYDLFRLDCGARRESLFLATSVPERPVFGEEVPMFVPSYGCDAFALFQAEYRGNLRLRIGLDADAQEPEPDGSEAGWWLSWVTSPEWVVFVDAGRGWSMGDGRDEEVAVDAGLGLFLQAAGIYAAVPLVGPGGVNLFVRLGPRF